MSYLRKLGSPEGDDQVLDGGVGVGLVLEECSLSRCLRGGGFVLLTGMGRDAPG